MKALLLALALSAAVSAQQPSQPVFLPPRILSASLPSVAPPTIISGGEVLIEAIIDLNGALTRPIVMRSTPPFTQMVLEAIGRWRFTPARERQPDGKDSVVQASILIAAVYRPPTFYNGPTIGESPKTLSSGSGAAPYPVAVVTPAHPPTAVSFTFSGSVLLFELVLDDKGAIAQTRTVESDAAFEGAAREALAQWKFKPGSHRYRPVPSTAYVLFAFTPPSVSPKP